MYKTKLCFARISNEKVAESKRNEVAVLFPTSHIIKEEIDVLHQFFINIIEDPSRWHSETINMANDYRNFFEDFTIQFLISDFAKLIKRSILGIFFCKVNRDGPEVFEARRVRVRTVGSRF